MHLPHKLSTGHFARGLVSAGQPWALCRWVDKSCISQGYQETPNRFNCPSVCLPVLFGSVSLLPAVFSLCRVSTKHLSSLFSPSQTLTGSLKKGSISLQVWGLQATSSVCIHESLLSWHRWPCLDNTATCSCFCKMSFLSHCLASQMFWAGILPLRSPLNCGIPPGMRVSAQSCTYACLLPRPQERLGKVSLDFSVPLPNVATLNKSAFHY